MEMTSLDYVATRSVLLILLIAALPALLNAQLSPWSNYREMRKAAKRGDTERALQLLREGALVNALDSDGTAILDWAAAMNNEVLVRALVNERAIVTPQAVRWANTNGHTQLAAWLKRQAARRRLPSNSAADAELLIAARTGNVATAIRALRNGANVEARDTSGQTPLLLAREAVLKDLLVDRGARSRRESDSDSRERIARRQEEQQEQVWGSLVAVYGLGHCAAASENSAVSAIGARIMTTSEQLNNRWKRAQELSDSEEPTPQSYMDDLRSLGAVAEKLRRVEDPAQQQLHCKKLDNVRHLEQIAADLEVKLRHCEVTGTSLGGRVKVRIRTRRGSDEAKGWTVHYVSKFGDSVGSIDTRRFPLFSSPTEWSLSPGLYVVWATQGDAVVSPKSTVTVIGKDTLEFDLAVP
jgi:hypothetical protein